MYFPEEQPKADEGVCVERHLIGGASSALSLYRPAPSTICRTIIISSGEGNDNSMECVLVDSGHEATNT